MPDEIKGTVTEIENLVRRATLHTEGLPIPLAIVPNGHQVHKVDLEEFEKTPRRLRESITLNTVDDFLAYVEQWKLPATLIFADQGQRSLRALIDYHNGPVAPAWVDHTASYTARLSRQAEAWLGQDAKVMSQLEFAEFLEERAIDVVQPSGATVLEVATNLQIITKATFGSMIKLASGEFNLKYAEENSQQGNLVVPDKITIGIPLYHHGPAYTLDLRLRYRLKEGRVTFSYKIVNRDDALEHAFNEICEKVKGAVGSSTPLLQGSRKK